MKKCKHCQKEIDSKAIRCPYCQSYQRSWFRRHPILTILIVFFIIGIAGSSSSSTQQSINKEEEITNKVVTNKPEEKPKAQPTSKPTITVIKKQVVSDIFPTRDEAYSIVKKVSENKWKDDYEMVKYEIDNQMVAYDWLITQDQHIDIMKRAREKWGDDYEMVKYEYENQVKAYESL